MRLSTVLARRGFFFIIIVAWLVLPMHITPVSPGLEDVQSYFAALEIQYQKTVLQNTLPANEEVVEIYEDPKYFQVTDTCDWQFVGSCVQAMAGPGATYPKAYVYYEKQGSFPAYVRTGQVFPMGALIKATDGSLWYKIAFDKSKMLFPNRLRTDWFVPAEHFTLVDFTPINPENDAIKKVVIVLGTQELYAYEGDTLFMKTKISSGQSALNLVTSTGSFRIYRKTPMAIMEGPLPSMVSMVTPANLADFEYTLFVPYAMAFHVDYMGTSFIHEAYWHSSFGTERSHGCVNVSYENAVTLYNWAPDPSATKIPVVVLP